MIAVAVICAQTIVVKIFGHYSALITYFRGSLMKRQAYLE